MYAITPLTLTDADGHDLDCSGDKAEPAGCQAIIKWYADHGIDPYRRATAARVTKPGSEVTYSYDDGTTIKLVGTRNFRDNNAGNAIADLARLAKDGPFVILPAAWDGMNAVAQKLHHNSEQTLLERIKIQTPEDDGKTPLLKGNDPAGYAKRLAAAAGPGISADTKIKDLTPDQFSRVVRALLREEGYFSAINKAVPGQK